MNPRGVTVSLALCVASLAALAAMGLTAFSVLLDRVMGRVP